MTLLSLHRFRIALRNDALVQARLLAYATLPVIGLGLLAYLTNINDSQGQPQLFELLYSIVLVGGGILFTSLSWSDMHHALGRFHYLMLPISNLERFLVRYLLTAPLYFVYANVVFVVFEAVANGLSDYVFGLQTPLLTPASSGWRSASALFFVLHTVVFAGAIRYRNLVLPRLALALMGWYLALALVSFVAARLFFWNYFTGLGTSTRGINLVLVEALSAGQVVALAITLAALASLWVLYLAWLMLNDHEVQDGL